MLSNGTFLVALLQRVVHLSADGTSIIRVYPIPSSTALALDIDRVTFWTNAGNYLLRVNIATGAVVSETRTDFVIRGISVVGEPRAGQSHGGPGDVHPIPTASNVTLVLLALTLCTAVLLRLSERV